MNNGGEINFKNDKQNLFELIKQKGIIIKDVILSNGKPSKYYYDLKPVVLTPTGAHLIGKLLLQEVLKFDVKSIGGLEVGATLLAPLITLKSSEHNPLDAFFVRKYRKKHGLEKEIEGNLTDPAVIVDDVITSGNSVMQTIDKIEKQNKKVNGIVCIIDREEGAKRIFKEKNIKFISLFTHSNFKDYIRSELKLRNPSVEINSYI